ncbi:hypothetical protein [Actinokineospora sp. HUAS TT18]|uniref:hypothetical protein n=1 Tax=Actinokineospora sp. HUAS TT18 TaxID=3447451 RepID=UPI003F51CC47
MNTTPPVERDLPLDRHLAIRSELLRATRTAPRRRVVPMVSAAAAFAVIAAAAVFVSTQRGEPSMTPGAEPTAEPPQLGTTGRPGVYAPTLPNLPKAERAEIEQGCAQPATGQKPAKLYNLITDGAGKVGLLYTEDAALECSIGGPGMPFNPGSAGVRYRNWLPGVIGVDVMSASAGGDVPGGKREYRGKHGTQTVAGRISEVVARVTYTEGDTTVDAVIANGTFIARIVRPTTWAIPEDTPPGVVRAYGANNDLLAATDDPVLRNRCWLLPDGTRLTDGTDPDCLTAVHWG